jgi:hypothetical protein
MKINQIVATMSNGMARTNRFSVVMSMPAFLADDGITPFRNLLLFCDQATLPGLQVNTTPIRIFGEVRETPTEYNYEPITLSFYVDQTMHIKAWFDAWIKNLQYGNERTFRYYDNYICPQMQILVQDTLDQSRYQVNLYEVWPKNVGSIQLDYASKDIMKLSVTLQYKYWDYTTVDAPVGDTSLLMGELKGQIGPDGMPQATQQGRNGAAFVEPDINKIKQIPQQYFSDINSFQANAQKNIMSDLNAKMNEGLNSLRGTAQGALTDLWNAW